jgi:hypothetical protein
MTNKVTIEQAVMMPTRLFACTIFCAKDQHGHMWAGNNEDFYTSSALGPETP